MGRGTIQIDLPPRPGNPAPNFRLASFKSPRVPHLLLFTSQSPARQTLPTPPSQRPRPRKFDKDTGRGRDGDPPGVGTRVLSGDPELGTLVAARKQSAVAGATRRPGRRRLPAGSPGLVARPAGGAMAGLRVPRGAAGPAAAPPAA